MIILLAVVLGYLIGGVPTGILISRAVAGVDPRTLGSGSSGATNVSRAIGRKWALVVLVLDACKGFLPAFFLAPLIPSPYNLEWVRVAMAIGAVVGHVWTPYASFRGGKGVATAAGTMLAIDPVALGAALVVWIILALLFRKVSLASVCAAVAVPVAMIIFGNRSPVYVKACVLLAALLIYTHRENIQRLITGREKPVL